MGGYQITVWQFAGNLSFGLTAVSFYVKDMMALRALSILAGAAGVLYNYFLPQGTRCLVWPTDELRKLLKRNPTMDIAMSTVFSLDLAKKLGGA